jgi:hypothetical protein
MMEQMTNVPAGMVGFRATGEITEDDYRRVVIPAVERLVRMSGTINFLLLLDTSVTRFSPGAWWQDTMMGLRRLTRWRRAAIVADSEGIRKFTDMFSKLAPGEFKGFTKEQLPNAIEWTSDDEYSQHLFI